MAYASLSDVQAMEPARVYGASTTPATSQVGLYLDNRAAEIDSILLEKGYSLPVPTTASSALLLLRKVNAQGAWADVSAGAPGSPFREASDAAYQSALAMLKAANTILDIPKNEIRASPRGPGLTTPQRVIDQPYDPYNTCTDGQGNPVDTGAPFFTRSQQF
jgi:hypothetical protein